MTVSPLATLLPDPTAAGGLSRGAPLRATFAGAAQDAAGRGAPLRARPDLLRAKGAAKHCPHAKRTSVCAVPKKPEFSGAAAVTTTWAVGVASVAACLALV